MPDRSSSLHLPPPELLRSILEPEFIPHDDNRYHVRELLKYHGRDFVRNAYRAILKREPDEAGCAAQIKMLLEGRYDKVDVLASLRYSAEGREKNVTVEGLALPALLRRLYRLPVLGYMVELVTAVARLPLLIRQRRGLEAYAVLHQQQLADRLRQFSERLQLVRTELARAASDAPPASQEGRDFPQESLTQRPVVEEEERHHLDAFYALFEEQFRGRRREIKERLKVYLPLLRAAEIKTDILDIGCGRGEWLELLKEEGVAARGVDLNRVMVAECRRRGFETVEADAISYLKSLPDESLRAVTSFHFVEHLPFEALIRLLDEIERTLKPGGLVILETPNPKNLLVGACSFYSDPTHRNPLFPETLQFILNNRGFAHARLEYLNPAEGSPFADRDEGSRTLDNWFFGPRDFAVIAWKA